MYTNRGGTRGGQEEVGHFPFPNNFFSSWGQTIGHYSTPSCDRFGRHGDYKSFCKGRQFGNFCSGGKELRCSLSYLIVNTDKMKFDHVNTVLVSIRFRHTFLSSLVLVA